MYNKKKSSIKYVKQITKRKTWGQFTILLISIIKLINFSFFLGLGIPERMEYIPGSGSRVLVPDAELQLCDFPCETENVTVRMSLATHHIGKGCDRDTYSVESQRKLCGKFYS